MWIFLVFLGICILIAFINNFGIYLLFGAILIGVIYLIYYFSKSKSENQEYEDLKYRCENNAKFNKKIQNIKDITDLLFETKKQFNTRYWITTNPVHPLSSKDEENDSIADYKFYLHIYMAELYGGILEIVSEFPNTPNGEYIMEYFSNRIFNKKYDEIKDTIDVYDWILAVRKCEIINEYDNNIIFTLEFICRFDDSESSDNSIILKGNDRNIFLNRLIELGCKLES